MDLPIGIVGATAIACVLYMLLSLVLCAMIASPKVGRPFLGTDIPIHNVDARLEKAFACAFEAPYVTFLTC